MSALGSVVLRRGFSRASKRNPRPALAASASGPARGRRCPPGMVMDIVAAHPTWRQGNQFKALAETSADAIIVFNDSDVIPARNRAAGHLCGRHGRDSLGKPLGATIIPPKFHGRHCVGLRRPGNRRAPHPPGGTAESEALHADGSTFPIEISLSSWMEDGRKALEITIHNQGEVPEDVRDHFFDPYVTSHAKAGFGLGTYSARLIAGAHEGDIEFSTSAEEGTCVTVLLPAPMDN